MPEQQNPIKDALGFLKYLTACWPDDLYLQAEAYAPELVKGVKPRPDRETVAPADIDKLVAWIVDHNDVNVYYRSNPLSGPQGSGRGGAATKADIACAVCVHLDLDPAEPPAGVDLQKHHTAERLRLRQQLDDFKPAPSWVVDSGGGFQAFWRLVAPVTVAEAEEINKALCLYFQTPDSCTSAQHLMRMPFTWNVPGYKKLAKGRTQVEARLLYATEVAYELSDFDDLPRVAAKASASAALAAVPGDLPARFVELLQGDEDLRARWEGNTDNLNDTSRNALDMSITALLVRRGFNDAEIAQVLHGFPHGKVSQDGRGADYIRPMLDKCRANRMLSRTEPMPSARRLVAERFTSPDGVRLLRHWNGVFYAWSGGAYHQRDKKGVEAEVWAYLEGARQYIGKSHTKTEPFKPNRARAGDVLGALEAVTHQDSRYVNPCWLDGANGDDPRDLLVVANGLLNTRDRKLQPHNPRLFTTTALPFAYDAAADPPRAWLAFLQSVWPNDRESIELLQEYMGYCLTADCSQQKILLVVGPKRSGKGTIARVQGALVGPANCCSPTLASLATNFGLQPLIDKRVATVSDARLGNRTDKHALTERLCSISGEDQQTIDIKNRDAWTGRLGVRLIVFTNELPKIVDSSNALSSRFIVLRMTNSFFGKEDLGLADRLLAELPGILNWSLDGLERLRKRGAFVQPQSASEMVQDLEDIASPINAFIRDLCVVGPTAQVEKQRLYDLWGHWRSQHGWHFTDTIEAFGVELHAVVPELKTVRPRQKGERPRLYVGIGIATGTATVEDLRRGTGDVDEVTAARIRKNSLL